jgi:hypothetical protein
MSDDALFHRDVVEHLLFNLARSRIFEDVSAGKPWNVDLGTSVLDIGGQRYESQILGTFAAGSRTFLWAWANPGAGGWEPSLQAAKEARSLAGKPGHALFGEKELPEARVDPRELAHVTAELVGGHPVYAPTAGGAVVFLIVGTPVDPRTISPAYIPGILVQLQSISRADKLACVARFFERLEYTTEISPRHIAATRGSTRVDVSFDEHGRLAKADLATGQRPASS